MVRRAGDCWVTEACIYVFNYRSLCKKATRSLAVKGRHNTGQGHDSNTMNNIIIDQSSKR